MTTSIIPILEFSIYLIVGIMGLLVVLYLYLTKPKKEKIEKEPNLIESNEEQSRNIPSISTTFDVSKWDKSNEVNE